MNPYQINWEPIEGKPDNYLRLIIFEWEEDDRLSGGGSYNILDIAEGEREFLQEVLIKRITPWKGVV